MMKFRAAHGHPGPNRTGPGPNIGLPRNNFRYLRVISELYRRAGSPTSLESAWYGAFSRRVIKHVMPKVRKKLINPCEFSKCYDHKAFMIHL